MTHEILVDGVSYEPKSTLEDKFVQSMGDMFERWVTVDNWPVIQREITSPRSLGEVATRIIIEGICGPNIQVSGDVKAKPDDVNPPPRPREYSGGGYAHPMG